MKKKTDPQGHLIIEPNVWVYGGRRYCLACKEARLSLPKERRMSIEYYRLADQIYRGIMSRSGVSDADGVSKARSEA